MDLNHTAFADLYRIAKLISKRTKGVVAYPTPAGMMPMDVETVLKDLDSAVALAETCPCCGSRRVK